MEIPDVLNDTRLFTPDRSDVEKNMSGAVCTYEFGEASYRQTTGSCNKLK